MASLLQVLNAVPLLTEEVLQGVALVEVEVVLIDDVEGLDGVATVMVATHLVLPIH